MGQPVPGNEFALIQAVPDLAGDEVPLTQVDIGLLDATPQVVKLVEAECQQQIGLGDLDWLIDAWPGDSHLIRRPLRQGGLRRDQGKRGHNQRACILRMVRIFPPSSQCIDRIYTARQERVPRQGTREGRVRIDFDESVKRCFQVLMSKNSGV